jgi:hypothetical protein
MIKRDELGDPNSCLNRAGFDEMLFVLRGHDVAAPATIERWAIERVAIGKNRTDDPEIIEALACAARMREDRIVPKDERLVWALEEEIASLNAHILRYAEGIAERDAEIERLTSQATQWRAHQDVIRQSVKPNTIHIVLRINKDGVFCEREAVASLYEIQHAVLGSRVVGEKCRRYYEELEDSCDRIASEHERGG